MSLEFGLTPSGLFSLRLTFELSTSESLRDVTRIGEAFPTVFRRLYTSDPKHRAKHIWASIESPQLPFLHLQ